MNNELYALMDKLGERLNGRTFGIAADASVWLIPSSDSDKYEQTFDIYRFTDGFKVKIGGAFMPLTDFIKTFKVENIWW